MSTTTQRIIFLAVMVFVIIGIFIVVVFGLKEPKPKEKIDLEFWSVYDDKDYFSELIKDYERLYPNVSVKYVKKNFEDYEKDLIDAFAAGRGPDIWSIHNTWLPKHMDKISPLPQNYMTIKEFKDSFVDVAFYDLVLNERIYGLPLYVDNLALYWNKDLFQTNGISDPPSDWDNFVENTKILTKKDNFGNITRAGVSLGTAYNINRSTDIVALLMLQTGTQMNDPDSKKALFNKFVSLDGKPFFAGEEALRFYTDFANPQKEVYTWNPELDYSIDAFYQGESAMMINYSHHIDTIKNKSSYLNFGVAPIPQIKDNKIDVTYANYWVPTVSAGSNHPDWAWHFLQTITLKDSALKYLEKSNKPTARRDLVNSQKDDVYLGVFAKQALTARSWYQIDNVAVENIFADMIESVVLGQATIKQAIDKAVNQINVLYRK
jgi:ABC-type glycerol-3-phosphate transport system substrate-binding protein